MPRYLFIMAQEAHRWGGSEPLWSSVAGHLAQAGNDVRVSAKDWGTPVPQVERLRTAGCKLFYRRNPLPRFLTRQFRRVFPPPPFRESHLRKLGADVDIVIVSQGGNVDGLEWLEAARALKLRYVTICQSSVEYWWPPDEMTERFKTAYDGATRAYFVSQAILELSRLQFGTALSNGRLVRNPFNVRYDARLRWPSPTDDSLALACVGSLDVTYKGQDVLLRVLALPHWRRRELRVSLFGEGQHANNLRRTAARLGLKNVQVCAFQNNVEAIWERHHALVLPSRVEGMPAVVVEAMLCGRPCIATDVGGNRELVRDDINGFLAKASTVELLNDAMERAWQARDRLMHMGEIAARDVREWVSREPVIDFATELERVATNISQPSYDADRIIGAPHYGLERAGARTSA